MKTILRLNILSFMLLIVVTAAADKLRKFDVNVTATPSVHPGKLRVTYVKSLYDTIIYVRFVDGKTTKNVILQKGGFWNGDLTCTAIYARAEGGQFIELVKAPSPATPPSSTHLPPSPQPVVVPIAVTKVVADFRQHVETIPYYSELSILKDDNNIHSLIDSLRNGNDKTLYADSIKNYVSALRDSIKTYAAGDSLLIDGFLRCYAPQPLIDTLACLDSLHSILKVKHQLREAGLKRLEYALNNELEDGTDFQIDRNMIIVGGSLLVLLVSLFLWYRSVRRKQKNTASKTDSQFHRHDVSVGDSSDIVVINTEAPVLRKQSLDDVIGNESYLKIPASDFCVESAVRDIYIKDSCVKDIYNMYANDLRNPENPKEDGCMVLGRWVLDKDTMLYDVSLEHIVLPGDDAVFAEYELNFGGKIKLREREMLRKLRQSTNLQYDLTCWVHSHPGLGVFFSNSDNNVHMQLKKPGHPNFLTAIVVDILTPDQELGIFTFRQDSTINSKADLTKMYSLEDMYKWAIATQRNSFNPQDHYNTLTEAVTRSDECYGIELSNGAIIDMSQLAVEHNVGFVGMVHGYSCHQANHIEHIVMKVTKEEAVPDYDLIGCFFIGTHCSIPSIRKAITPWLSKVHFVLVYTPSNGLVTSIPVVSQELQGSEDYYGEQTIEDMKIWTRRKR